MISKKIYEETVGKRIRYDILLKYETVVNLIKKYKKGKLKILDVGCGYGFLSFFADKNWIIYGIDLDEERIKRAKNIKQHKNSIFMIGDAENLNFNKKFDVILTLDVIEHLYHPEKYLRLVSKALKKDGIFIVSNPNPHSVWTLLFDNRVIRLEKHRQYWSTEEFAKMAKKTGFEMIEALPRPFFGEAIGWFIGDYRRVLKSDLRLGKMFPNNCTGCFLVFKIAS